MLYSSAAVCLVLVLLSTTLLIAVFALGWEESPLAGCVYALSFYTLSLVIAALARGLRALRGVVDGNASVSRFFGDYAFRAGLGLYAGLGVNLCFSALKLLTGWACRSAWLSAVARTTCCWPGCVTACCGARACRVTSQSRSGRDRDEGPTCGRDG